MLIFKKPKFGFPWTVRDVKNLNDVIDKYDETLKKVNELSDTIEDLKSRITALENA